MYLNGRWLQCKWLRLREGLVFRCELCAFRIVFTVLCRINRVVMQMRWESGIHRRLLDTRGVGSRLGLELSQIKIRSSFVPEIHGLGEPPLRIEAKEYNSINGNGDDLDNDFDNSTDKRPILGDC